MGGMKLKSTIIAGILSLAAIAFAPVANAQVVLGGGRPTSCNQKLVNCIEQATLNFDCCTGLDGILSDHCDDAPLPAFGTPSGLANRPTSVAACLVNFNITTTFCNVRYTVCTVLNPGGGSGGGAGNEQ
jgi:hypothetical protein